MRIGNPGCLLAVALVAVAPPAAAQTVGRYANGQSAYPSGVSDPSGWNPAAPPMNAAVPVPPTPDTPIRSVPPGSVAPWSTAPAQQNADGLAGPSFGPSAPIYGPGTTAIGSDILAPGASGPSYAPPAQVLPSPATVAAAASPPAAWYTRVEYFHWNEKVAGADFVNESGTLFTLGYQRQFGIERIRAEMFGGEVHYDGYGQFDGNGVNETLPSNTGYLGLRGEYEMIWEPAAWQGRIAFLGGLGSRFWFRDLHDGTTPDGNPVYGYEETWWTFYPYLGAETHFPLRQNLDLYSESRVGATVLTYDYATIGDRPVWPKPGVMANVEIGLRYTHFFAALRGEVMRWEDSSVVQGAYQPRSTMYTAGGRLRLHVLKRADAARLFAFGGFNQG